MNYLGGVGHVRSKSSVRKLRQSQISLHTDFHQLSTRQDQPDTCICLHSQIILAYAGRQSNIYLGGSIMTQKNDLNSQASRCSCTTLRKASRRISQLYDAALAPSGLKTT